MIVDIKESQELCEWLMKHGLGLGECARFLCNLNSGDTFAIALFKVYEERTNKLEEMNEKIRTAFTDWNASPDRVRVCESDVGDRG